MIPVKDITKVTGYVRGGCSPLGMKKQFKTTFHITAESIPKIIVSAGKIGYQIDLKPEDLIRLTNGQCADIIKDLPDIQKTTPPTVPNGLVGGVFY